MQQDLLTSNTPKQQEPLFLPNTKTTEETVPIVAPTAQQSITPSEGDPTEESTQAEGASNFKDRSPSVHPDP